MENTHRQYKETDETTPGEGTVIINILSSYLIKVSNINLLSWYTNEDGANAASFITTEKSEH